MSFDLAPRPRDAATLIVIRDRREVLLGVRSARHVFMPEVYVFPGGRVDSADSRVFSESKLRPDVEARLVRDTSPARARGLAMAAIRETYEETGLILGRNTTSPATTRSAQWREFHAAGYVPAIDKLDYVARAITPPGSPRRFDARFFVADAADLTGELRGNGELEDLHWVPLQAARRLPLSEITELMLMNLDARLRDPEQPHPGVLFYRDVRGREVVTTEP